MAILLLGLNLRSAVSTVGPVLDRISDAYQLSSTLAGILTTLPVLCFAGFGAIAASVAKRFGVARTLTVALVVIVAGQLVRAATDNTVLFMITTVVALGGMAIGNVLIPVTVRAHFPKHVGLMTAAYTILLGIGTMLPAALTVPISDAAGSWRVGIGAWGATAAIALLPWLIVTVRQGKPASVRDSDNSTLHGIAKSKLAWALAVFFGIQATQAYAALGWLPQIFQDAGVDPTTAGLLLSVWPIAGIPMSLALPVIAAKLPDPKSLVIACGLLYLIGYTGLLIAPGTIPLAWMLCIGLGGGAFPLALTLIAMRTRAPEVTAKLSGFVQSVGYLIAAIGPLTLGPLHDWTGGWTVPILLLAGLIIPQVVAGVLACRPRQVDDELRIR